MLPRFVYPINYIYLLTHLFNAQEQPPRQGLLCRSEGASIVATISSRCAITCRLRTTKFPEAHFILSLGKICKPPCPPAIRITAAFALLGGAPRSMESGLCLLREEAVLAQIREQILCQENVYKYLSLVLEQAGQQPKTAVEMALRDLDAKLRRWEEALEGGLLSLEDCAARIKELRQQREALLKRKIELHKKARAGAKILPTPTRLMNEYVQQMRLRLQQKNIGFRKEFIREILKEVRVKGNTVRLTYKLPMTVRTPPSESEKPRTGEFFTLYQLVELMGVEPTASRVRF